MIKMLSQDEFMDRVQKLYRHHFDAYAFKPCDISGVIYPSRAPEMLEFCRENPEYHVVSNLLYYFVNHYVPEAYYYYIAFGDHTPSLAMPVFPRSSISNLEPLNF